VEVRSIAHKGLRRLYEENSSKGLSADTVNKLRKMLAFLDAMQNPEELRALPLWKAHILTGNRKGTWSLHVTRNWRLTSGSKRTRSSIWTLRTTTERENGHGHP
jgi:proteic killer suppression protein